jgi:predicted O-linked N-acetylglucosamine transferase (SPINDLY family)
MTSRAKSKFRRQFIVSPLDNVSFIVLFYIVASVRGTLTEKSNNLTVKQLHQAIVVFQERLSSHVFTLQPNGGRQLYRDIIADLFFQIGLANQLLSRRYSSPRYLSLNDLQSLSKYHTVEATTHYNICLKFKNDHIDASINLAMLSPPPIALHYLHKALEKSPSHLQCRINLGLLYQTVLHDYNEAIKVFTESISYHPYSIDLHYNLAKSYTAVGQHQAAIRHYQAILSSIDENNLHSWINLAVAYHQHGDLDTALNYYSSALKAISFHLNKTVVPTGEKVLHNFVNCHKLVLNNRHTLPNPFHYDLSDMLLKDYLNNSTKDNSLCRQIIHSFLNEVYTALLHLYPETELHHDLQLLFKNMGNAFAQIGDFSHAMGYHYAALSLVHHEISQLKNKACRFFLMDEVREKTFNRIILKEDYATQMNVECGSIYNLLIQVACHIFQSGRAGCYFSIWEWFDQLYWFIEIYQLYNGKESSFLPFDTLGLPVGLSWRKKVAERHAAHFRNTKGNFSVTLNKTDCCNAHSFPPAPQQQLHVKPLVVSFLSQDFAEHPTAHLVEGLFVNNHKFQALRSSVHYRVYSYGKNDSSVCRKNIENLVGGLSSQGGNFFDLSRVDDDTAIQAIRGSLADSECTGKKLHSSKVCNDGKMSDIVYDLQGFTFKGRPELVAARLAPIQVNFLVFPGTSGSPTTDYIVGDKLVTPPEDAHHYTEKLALMPHSYQANYYHRYVKKNEAFVERGSEEWISIRQREGLPTSGEIFVLANFNKQDKLEPKIFSAWMDIMSQVPNSVLWLLEPSHHFKDDDGHKCAEKNVLSQAAIFGIWNDRIIFARRVTKAMHLRRMWAADLFLDTHIYGAHTSASDALITGLPVLTLVGETFSSRVGLSLLENIGQEFSSILASWSVDEYIETAVDLAQGMLNSTKTKASLLYQVRSRLFSRSNESYLFDDETYTKNFNRMSKALQEVYLVEGNRMHVIVAA